MTGSSTKNFIKDPGIDIAPVTPNDSEDLPDVTVYGKTSALILASGGTIKVRTVRGEDRTLTLPAGIFPVQITKVYATGTGASDISVIY